MIRALFSSGWRGAKQAKMLELSQIMARAQHTAAQRIPCLPPQESVKPKALSLFIGVLLDLKVAP